MENLEDICYWFSIYLTEWLSAEKNSLDNQSNTLQGRNCILLIAASRIKTEPSSDKKILYEKYNLEMFTAVLDPSKYISGCPS